MVHRRTAAAATAFFLLVLAASGATAEMGPCVPAIDFGLICGSADAAARVIVKTISPSQRLGFAWRLANRPPINRPDDNDPNLENLIVRLDDGAVLAKSHGAYWDLGTKIAKAYLMTAWSPDSRLLVKVEQRAESVSAELFSFAENDAAIGPFDLARVIKPAVLATMKRVKDAESTTLVFAAHPAMSIDEHRLFHAAVSIKVHDATGSPPYDVAVQVTRAANSINAKIASVAPHPGAIISIIVY